ncbi:hypothetical protein [Sphingobacterium sp.]|uniref:hypothetical protein n=1 Tax=Sphingobacterium sp. TaxID=341027 RepID=UPI0031CF0770
MGQKKGFAGAFQDKDFGKSRRNFGYSVKQKYWKRIGDPTHFFRWESSDKVAKGSETSYCYPPVRNGAERMSGHRNAGTAIKCKQAHVGRWCLGCTAENRQLD